MGSNFTKLNYDFAHAIEKIQTEYIRSTMEYSIKNADEFHNLFTSLKRRKCKKDNPLECAVDTQAYYGEISKYKYVVLSNYNCLAEHYIILLYNVNNKKTFKIFKLYDDICKSYDEYYKNPLDYIRHADIHMGYTDNILTDEYLYVHRPNLKYFEDNIDIIIKGEDVMFFSPILTNDEQYLMRMLSFTGYGASTYLRELKRIHFMLESTIDEFQK